MERKVIAMSRFLLLFLLVLGIAGCARSDKNDPRRHDAKETLPISLEFNTVPPGRVELPLTVETVPPEPVPVQLDLEADMESIELPFELNVTHNNVDSVTLPLKIDVDDREQELALVVEAQAYEDPVPVVIDLVANPPGDVEVPLDVSLKRKELDKVTVPLHVELTNDRQRIDTKATVNVSLEHEVKPVEIPVHVTNAGAIVPLAPEDTFSWGWLVLLPLAGALGGVARTQLFGKWAWPDIGNNLFCGIITASMLPAVLFVLHSPLLDGQRSGWTSWLALWGFCVAAAILGTEFLLYAVRTIRKAWQVTEDKTKAP